MDYKSIEPLGKPLSEMTKEEKDDLRDSTNWNVPKKLDRWYKLTYQRALLKLKKRNEKEFKEILEKIRQEVERPEDTFTL